jgi:nitroimidazol reductase NimA-like FMN-containing flavoprotein (pyridoxamine 5'-phosphate oxidase superfamily)
MPRPMRRGNLEVSTERAFDILASGDYGFLSTVSEDGSPYCIALSHVLIGKAIYFHCAVQGHKIDNIRRDNRVCYTVVGRTRVVQAELTVEYESAVVFGRAEIIEDKQEKSSAMLKICEKYTPEFMGKAEEIIPKALDKMLIGKITIDHISGKAKAGKITVQKS